MYRRLAADVQSCWDRTEFDAFYMRPWLERALAELALPRGARVLEIGCGSGPISCFLEARGYDVLGPISRRPRSRWRHGTRPNGTSPLGSRSPTSSRRTTTRLLYDNERRSLLSAVAHRLRPGAAFVIETMAHPPDVRFDAPPGRTVVLDDDGVLWTSLPDDPPNRRVLSASALADELRASGFAIEHEEVARTALREEP